MASTMVLPQRLKVLHVVDSLELGGLERVVTDLALAQQCAGDEVAVFSINDTAGHRFTLETAGIPVIQGGKRSTADLGVLRALWQGVCEADIVHAHNFVPNYYCAAALLAASRKPLVLTCHDMGFRLRDRKLRLLFRLSLARTTRVAMVSRQVLDHYLASGMIDSDAADVILNGIDTSRFDSGEALRLDARRALHLPADGPVIGAVGRMVALKNHRALLAAMPRLLGTNPGLNLVLAGDGPLRADLEKQAQSLGVATRVHFLGERKDIAALLPAFDVFAMPSLTEGLSIALLEACACGLAIVASEVGGNPEIVSDRKRGILYPAGDDNALTAALLAMLGDAPMRRRLGEAARDWVRDNCSIAATGRAYDECYRAACRMIDTRVAAADLPA